LGPRGDLRGGGTGKTSKSRGGATGKQGGKTAGQGRQLVKKKGKKATCGPQAKKPKSPNWDSEKSKRSHGPKGKIRGTRETNSKGVGVSKALWGKVAKKRRTLGKKKAQHERPARTGSERRNGPQLWRKGQGRKKRNAFGVQIKKTALHRASVTIALRSKYSIGRETGLTETVASNLENRKQTHPLILRKEGKMRCFGQTTSLSSEGSHTGRECVSAIRDRKEVKCGWGREDGRQVRWEEGHGYHKVGVVAKKINQYSSILQNRQALTNANKKRNCAPTWNARATPSKKGLEKRGGPLSVSVAGKSTNTELGEGQAVVMRATRARGRRGWLGTEGAVKKE